MSKDKQEKRVTYVADRHTHKQIRKLAYWERKTIKQIHDEALSAYIDRYKDKHGAIKDIPQ